MFFIAQSSIDNALKNKIAGVVLVPCRITVSLLWILSALVRVALRYAYPTLTINNTKAGNTRSISQTFDGRLEASKPFNPRPNHHILED